MRPDSRIPRLLGAALLIAAAPLLVSGCSGDDSGDDSGPGSIDTAELEKRVEEGLAEELGPAPYPITIDCPDPLPAEVEATVRCTLKGGPDDLGVTLTVTSVDDEDGRAEFDIDVDDEPL